jgi:hypothetical protein
MRFGDTISSRKLQDCLGEGTSDQHARNGSMGIAAGDFERRDGTGPVRAFGTVCLSNTLIGCVPTMSATTAAYQIEILSGCRHWKDCGQGDVG